MSRPIRLAWDEPAPGDLMEVLMNPSTIYGYRTNEDGSETLSWRVDDAGRVHCDHLDEGCCGDCVTADERLVRRRGTVVVVRPDARPVSLGVVDEADLRERIAQDVEALRAIYDRRPQRDALDRAAAVIRMGIAGA